MRSNPIYAIGTVITRFIRVIQTSIAECPALDCPDKPGNDGAGNSDGEAEKKARISGPSNLT
jgi:hypothetical protein